MQYEQYFYNCSREYIDLINADLIEELLNVLHNMPKLTTQAIINLHLHLSLIKRGWSYDTRPSGLKDISPEILNKYGEYKVATINNRDLCLTSTTLGANWHADFAKSFDDKLVHIEVQFGKVEAMFKDFCGFRIAYFERRLALGVEIVMSEPYKYFAHRKGSGSGMAYFEIAKRTLPAIRLNCPIWLIGIKE